MSIELDIDGPVAIVTINRPERKNAISMAMRREIQDVFLRRRDDDEVRAIILTGAGTDFSAGADVGEIGGGGIRGQLGSARARSRMVRAVAHTQKPVIAAVEGVCMGMAFSMALACDFIFCSKTARFQFAFRHIGLAMDAAAGWLLERHVGVMRAKEIADSGRMVGGTEAAGQRDDQRRGSVGLQGGRHIQAVRPIEVVVFQSIDWDIIERRCILCQHRDSRPTHQNKRQQKQYH